MEEFNEKKAIGTPKKKGGKKKRGRGKNDVP